MSFLQTIDRYWHEITAWGALIDMVLVAFTICWVLSLKKEPTSALAWCLLVILVPVFGMIFFVLFGYQHVHRPVSRKMRHRTFFRRTHQASSEQETPGEGEAPLGIGWDSMARLAMRFDAFPQTMGNQVEFYHEGPPAFDAMLEAIAAAKHHVHLEFFIVQPDESGLRFRALLEEKARAGVEVRLLYDAMGSVRLRRRWLEPLLAAGGKATAFLPLAPLQRRIQVNLRNHRKILVVDGQVGFTGGLNIGDEYLGKVPRFGFWRDTHMRIRGPSVASLQRVFVEDWDFAAREHLRGDNYFPEHRAEGDATTQVVFSGPDQKRNAIREIYFAAIGRARRRLWIMTPYFVPDAGLNDALCLAAYQGVDVRLLFLFHPDKWVPLFAARYYFTDVLSAGVKVYQYTRGMMHSKVMLADGEWASVGSANLDNRSMHLNFELNCLIYSPEQVAVLEEAFRRDLQVSIQMKKEVYAQRPMAGRMIENACRLLSPIL
ncbi:MAG: cardiolipin synthase [Gemmataceae bacterium]|nr:cardiolipin synthase [Gemmataceae bacterium]